MSFSTTTTPLKEHGADEAGGEVIYTSDGVDVPAVRPPPLVVPTPTESLITTTTSSNTSAAAANDQHENAYWKQQPWLFGSIVGTPAMRLERVKQELHNIDLQVQADAALQADVQALHAQWQQQMTTGKATLTVTSPRSSSDLETLLLRLEKAVGFMTSSSNYSDGTGTTSSSSSLTLIERVTRLEHVVAVLDDAKLEATARKAKLLRHDVEAAVKARSKLLQGGSSHRADDAETIHTLHAAWLQLQDVSIHLPALSMRLQQLALQHAQASSFSQRLQALEITATQLQTLVGNAEQVTHELEQNWKEQAILLQSNLNALDERIAKLK